ncbi:MAG: hypothetical protein ACI85K_002305 [Hyphomicrobiaceae bacterium]|jgi:hypothetical protein
MLAIALVGVLFCQASAPDILAVDVPVVDVPAPDVLAPDVQAPKGGQGSDAKSSQSSSSKKLETWPDKLARQKVKAFQKTLKPKKVSMVVRKNALDTLSGGISQQLIKPLQQFIEKDSSIMLKKQAVAMLSDQPKERVKPVILKMLKNLRLTANPQVEAGLVSALSRTGYDAGDWKPIKDLLESDYDNERIPVHEALLELVKVHKEVQAIPMLLRNLEEPSPANVDVLENPPAEYWKARWHAWAVWKGKVKDALFAITGQRFSTAKEAQAWLKKNPIKKSKKKSKKR